MPLNAFLTDKGSAKHKCRLTDAKVVLVAHSGKWESGIWEAISGVMVGELKMPSVPELW